MRKLLDEFRTALAEGFYGENILRMSGLLAEARGNPAAANPAAYYLIESVLEDVHRRWYEQQPSTVETSRAIEARIVPAIEAALLAADADCGELMRCLNALIQAHAACRREIPTNI